MSHAPAVLVLGDKSAPEMQRANEVLTTRVSADRLRSITQFAEPAATIDDDWFPDLIVIFQTWSDQFTATDVQHVLSRFPLARLVCCYGPWCDSDGRTRSLWPPASRIPAEWAARRIESELDFMSGTLRSSGTLSLAPLPLTAGRDEVFEFDCGDPFPSFKLDGPVAVISPDRPWRDMIARALRSHQQPAVDELRIDTFFAIHAATSKTACRYDKILFDADPWDDSRAQELHSLRAAHSTSNLIAAVGYPRPHLVDELCAAGASHVACKLSPLAEWMRFISVPH